MNNKFDYYYDFKELEPYQYSWYPENGSVNTLLINTIYISHGTQVDSWGNRIKEAQITWLNLPGLGSRSRVLLAPWSRSRSRSRLKKKPGAGAGAAWKKKSGAVAGAAKKLASSSAQREDKKHKEIVL